MHAIADRLAMLSEGLFERVVDVPKFVKAIEHEDVFKQLARKVCDANIRDWDGIRSRELEMSIATADPSSRCSVLLVASVPIPQDVSKGDQHGVPKHVPKTLVQEEPTSSS